MDLCKRRLTVALALKDKDSVAVQLKKLEEITDLIGIPNVKLSYYSHVNFVDPKLVPSNISEAFGFLNSDDLVTKVMTEFEEKDLRLP